MNQYLGVQFHPEFMYKHPKIGEFVSLMENWTMKDGQIYASGLVAKTAPKRPLKYLDLYNTETETNF